MSIRKALPVWIDRSGVNQYIEARQIFRTEATGEAEAVSENAVLQICADTEYAAYLNGTFVGTGQYRTFRGTRYYDEYEVSSLLQEGENELRITALSEGVDTFVYQKGTPMLTFALQCAEQEILSGADTQVRVHPFYEGGEIEQMTPQVGFTYHYDASAADTPWEQAVIIKEEAVYKPRPLKKLTWQEPVTGSIYTQGILERKGSGNPAELMQTDGLFFRNPEEIFENNTLKYQESGAYFLIDLGEEYAGYLHLELEAAAGTVLDIGWGEHLEDLRIRTNVGGRCFGVRYICKEGIQEFTGYFRRMAGRYLQIHVTGMTGDVCIGQLALLPVEYPLERNGSFRCNDIFFNRLYQISEKTLRLCMHEHYEDCPWREQALYGYDSFLQMLCGYYMFGEYEFAAASLQLMADGLREDGLLPICFPTGESRTIPSFAFGWLLSFEKYVLYSGDLEFGRRNLKVAERILSWFPIREDLIEIIPVKEYWHFYEWTEGLNGRGYIGQDSAVTCYYILAYEAYRRVCGYTGTAENRELYSDLDRMRSALRARFWDEERGLLRTRSEEERCHELTQAMAILSGVTTDRRTYDSLTGQGSPLVKATLSGLYFKYEALLGAGEQYAEAVLEEIAGIWGRMLFAGAGTLWEVAEGAGAFHNAGSLCHGWSAIPIYFLYKYYLGYEPLSPGFGEYRLAPLTTDYISKIKAVLFRPGQAKKVLATDGKVTG